MDDPISSREGAVVLDRIVFGLCDGLRDLPGSYLAPEIPGKVLIAALGSYLELGDGEGLLAIVQTGGQDPFRASCALTTRRVCWPARSGPDRGRSLAYEDLPATIGRTDGFSPVIDLGEGRTIGLDIHGPIQDRLIEFLEAVGPLARGEANAPELSEATHRWIEIQWPRIARDSAMARKGQIDFRRFHALMVQRRAVVTPIVAAVCVLVSLAMLVAGVSPISPTSGAMLAWGANFGPSLAFDHPDSTGLQGGNSFPRGSVRTSGSGRRTGPRMARAPRPFHETCNPVE